MNIDTKDVAAVFRFTSRTHILVHAKNEFGEMEWTLNPRIDRSFKGKDDDIGTPVVHLTDQEAEALKKSGFSYSSYEE